MNDRTTPPPERRMSEVDRTAMKQALLSELDAPPKSRLRERLPRLTPVRGAAAVGLAALAILVAVALAPLSDNGGVSNPTLERANVALSRPNTIWHFKMSTVSHETARNVAIEEMEAWFESKDEAHVISRSQGLPAGRTDITPFEFESATDGKTALVYTDIDGVEAIAPNGSQVKSPFAGLGAQLDSSGDPKNMLKALIGDEGRILAEREVSYRGRLAREITVDYPAKIGGPGHVVGLFDQKTYYPIEFKTYLDPSSPHAIPGLGDRPIFETRFTTFEALPINNRTRQLLEMRPHLGVPVCHKAPCAVVGG